MITAMLIAVFVLSYKCMKISFKIFWIILKYTFTPVLMFTVYLVLFPLNVFTLPVWFFLYAHGRCTGTRTPYLDHWQSVFYPSYTNPAQKVKVIKPKEKPAVIKYVYPDYTYPDPLMWI